MVSFVLSNAGEDGYPFVKRAPGSNNGDKDHHYVPSRWASRISTSFSKNQPQRQSWSNGLTWIQLDECVPLTEARHLLWWCETCSLSPFRSKPTPLCLPCYVVQSISSHQISFCGYRAQTSCKVRYGRLSYSSVIKGLLSSLVWSSTEQFEANGPRGVAVLLRMCWGDPDPPGRRNPVGKDVCHPQHFIGRWRLVSTMIVTSLIVMMKIFSFAILSKMVCLVDLASRSLTRTSNPGRKVKMQQATASFRFRFDAFSLPFFVLQGVCFIASTRAYWVRALVWRYLHQVAR